MPEDSFLYKKIRVLPQPFQSDEGVGISNIHQDIVNLLDISLVEKRMPLILHGKQMNNYTNINNNDNAKNIYPWT